VLGTVVETKNLLETVLASVVAGVGVTGAFSLLILGTTRFADFRRDERPLPAAAAAALAMLALLVVLGGLVLGVVAMTSK